MFSQKSKIFFISSITTFILLFVGLTVFHLLQEKEIRPEEDPFEEYFELPVKIYLFNQGEKTEVEKKDNQYKKIIDMLNKKAQFEGSFETVDYVIMEENIKMIKNDKFAVELIYHQQKEFEEKYVFGSRTEEGYMRASYSRLLIPLTGKYEEMIIFGDDEEYKNRPLSKLPNNEHLINYVKNL